MFLIHDCPAVQWTSRWLISYAESDNKLNLCIGQILQNKSFFNSESYTFILCEAQLMCANIT